MYERGWLAREGDVFDQLVIVPGFSFYGSQISIRVLSGKESKIGLPRKKEQAFVDTYTQAFIVMLLPGVMVGSYNYVYRN